MRKITTFPLVGDIKRITRFWWLPIYVWSLDHGRDVREMRWLTWATVEFTYRETEGMLRWVATNFVEKC